MRMLIVAMLAGLPTALAACGGDDGADEVGSGPPLADTEYVQELCTGIKTWLDAVNTKSTEAELRAAVEAFVKDMREVSPPADARDFHSQFVKYLEDARTEPTLLLTKDPPLPAKDLRDRLAVAEREATCVAPLFTRGTATPTPGR